jgi:hypothetical protein
MRLIKISAPGGQGEKVIQLAFSAGIKEASLYQADLFDSDGGRTTKDIIDVQTSTQKAKDFVESVLEADFYDRETISISTRQPQSIVGRDDLKRLTRPLIIPGTDILEELWQFSHITWGFTARIFIGGGLLAFGLIHHQLLIMVAGLLFLPLLPLLLAVSFGLVTKEYKLTAQGAGAFLTSILLLTGAGVAVGLISRPPLQYDEFNSLLTGLIISFAVGLAAVLASADDSGKRELIGLAATSQVAIIPVWFGISFVFGFSPTNSNTEIYTRAGGLVLNTLMIIIAAAVTFFFCGILRPSLGRIPTE